MCIVHILRLLEHWNIEHFNVYRLASIRFHCALLLPLLVLLNFQQNKEQVQIFFVVYQYYATNGVLVARGSSV